MEIKLFIFAMVWGILGLIYLSWYLYENHRQNVVDLSIFIFTSLFYGVIIALAGKLIGLPLVASMALLAVFLYFKGDVYRSLRVRLLRFRTRQAGRVQDVS